MDLREAHERLVRHGGAVADALERHLERGEMPLYGSFDVRIHPGKAAAIDANAFPGGFNNLGDPGRKASAKAFRRLVRERGWEHAELLAEGHTRNEAYQENVRVLAHILEDAGLRVEATAEAKCAPLVVLNRDLADGPPHAVLRCPEVLPPLGMGWHVRRKAGHSRHLDAVVGDVAEAASVDPWLLKADWESAGPVSFAAKEGLDAVAEAVDRVLARAVKAARRNGAAPPDRAFVKADPGTYGMAIATFGSGAEVLAVNSRTRTKMERGKGGLHTQQVLVQEAVPTGLDASGPAEPCVYMVAGEVVGGFVRAHPTRGPMENLNMPGATFVPFGPGGPRGLPAHLRQVTDVVVRCAHAAMARETRDARGLSAPPARAA